MALLDICVTAQDTNAIVEVARGNIGVVSDILINDNSSFLNLTLSPGVGGGETSHAFQT